MKKILLSIICFIFLCSSMALAKSTRVISLSKFSTANPTPYYKVQFLYEQKLKDGTTIKPGTILSGSVTKISNAKRGKRNGYFEFIPTSYTYRGQTKEILYPTYYAKVVGYSPVDSQDIMESAVKGVAGFLVHGASQGISFIQGINDAPEGKKIKSGFVQVYKDSPLVYIEEGSELNINVGDMVVLKFKKL